MGKLPCDHERPLRVLCGECVDTLKARAEAAAKLLRDSLEGQEEWCVCEVMDEMERAPCHFCEVSAFLAALSSGPKGDDRG